jgi:hypothetical protein
MVSPIRMMKHLIPPTAWRWLRDHGRDLLHRTTYSKMTEEDFRRLNEQGLFVVGCARSGTTILGDCFNLSPDIYLLNEAHLFFNNIFGDFSTFFNKQRAAESRHRAKGTYIPPAMNRERGGFTAWLRLGKHYRYVGEKIALWPLGKEDGRKMPELFFEFHARYLFHAKYFLIARNPAEAVLSMSKMFCDQPLMALVECWLEALRVQLDVLDLFPNVYFTFLENLNQERLQKIGAVLGVEIPIGTGTVSKYWKATRLEAHELPPALAPIHSMLHKCDQLYDELMAAFCPDTFALKESVPRQRASGNGFLCKMRDRINELLAEVNRPRERIERDVRAETIERLRPALAPSSLEASAPIPNMSLDTSAYLSGSSVPAGR